MLDNQKPCLELADHERSLNFNIPPRPCHRRHRQFLQLQLPCRHPRQQQHRQRHTH